MIPLQDKIQYGFQNVFTYAILSHGGDNFARLRYRHHHQDIPLIFQFRTTTWSRWQWTTALCCNLAATTSCGRYFLFERSFPQSRGLSSQKFSCQGKTDTEIIHINNASFVQKAVYQVQNDSLSVTVWWSGAESWFTAVDFSSVDVSIWRTEHENLHAIFMSLSRYLLSKLQLSSRKNQGFIDWDCLTRPS